MKKIGYFISMLLIVTMLFSCEEFHGDLFVVSFVNNSSDSVCASLYGHVNGDESNKVIYFNDTEQLIAPSDTGYLWSEVCRNEGGWAPWGYFVGQWHLDTIYVVVHKQLTHNSINSKYNFPANDDILKVFKYPVYDVSSSQIETIVEYK